jgi:hypothetical protein
MITTTRLSSISTVFCTWFAIAWLVSGAPNTQAAVVDSINGSAEPANPFVLPSQDLGWLYQPTASYRLDAIVTRFGLSPRANYDRTVTVEIYSGLPANGGTLLRSVSFTPLANEFASATFPDLQVTAGNALFIGFRNVLSLGGNITSQAGAKNLGAAYTSDNGSYSTVTQGGFLTQPILVLQGSIPEPATVSMFGLGLIGLLIQRRRTGLGRKSQPRARCSDGSAEGLR